MEEVKSPILIVFELIKGLIENIQSSFYFIAVKLSELFVSLRFIANYSPIGFFIAIIFGSVVIFFLLKYTFGSSKALTILFIFYILIMFLLLSTVPV